MLAERLVAHRGFQRNYPENTLLAYRAAVAAGARAIETDIQLSADYQPVLYHDATLRRVSAHRGRLDALPLDALAKLPAHEPGRLGSRFTDNRITPLFELVDWLGEQPELTAYIEVKSEAIQFAGPELCYQRVMQALKPVAQQCVLISFDYEFIIHAHRHGWRRCGFVLKRWNHHRRRDLQALQPEVLFCDYRKLPTHADLHALKPQLVLYEIADAALAIHWLQRGADRIETFDIGGLLQALSEHQL